VSGSNRSRAAFPRWVAAREPGHHLTGWHGPTAEGRQPGHSGGGSRAGECRPAQGNKTCPRLVQELKVPGDRMRGRQA